VSKVGGALADGGRDFAKGVRTFPGSLRTAIRDPRSLTAGAPVAPILILFGHTFMDAFDRTGFAIILPEVQDHFDLDLDQVTGLAAVSIVAGILLSLPVSLWSDRSGRRTWFLAGGALIASVFSFTAGIAMGIGLFGASRAGFGFGLLVNDPVQQSLLSDSTPVPARPSVFAGRQMADNLGQLLGPLVFGLVAMAFGWRAPLFIVAVAALVLGLASARLREPTKGNMERLAGGATGEDLDVEEETAGFREAWRILRAIPTVRTLWFSLPFLLGGVLAIFVLLPLYLEEVFDMSAGERGVAQALMGIPAIFGLFVGIALTKRFLFSEAPWRMFQLMGSIALGIGLCVVWLAVVPNIALVLGGMTLLFLLAALVLPAYGTLFSIVMPAKARTVGFALTRLWALPGLVMLPIAGGIGDAHGLDVGILAGVPIFLIGALIVGLGGRSFQSDMAEAAESSMRAIEAQRERRKAARLAAEAAEGDALLD
jgi:MFS family permease